MAPNPLLTRVRSLLWRTLQVGACMVTLGALSLTVTIGFWGLSCALAALCLGLLPVRVRAVRGAGLVTALLLLTVGAPLLILDVQHRLDALAARLHGSGLRTVDCVRVAALNVAMGLGGLAVGYRELAAETLWMFVPGESVRVWHSDFAMDSLLVRRTVRELLDEARRRGGGRQRLELGPRSIAWSRRDMEHDSRRVALALNSPLRLEATAHRQVDGWRLELRGRAVARYPRRSRTVVGHLFGRQLVIEEGLFAALQDAGWLHPFEAVWCSSVAESDPRLEFNPQPR